MQYVKKNILTANLSFHELFVYTTKHRLAMKKKQTEKVKNEKEDLVKPSRLSRSETNRIIGGVAGGIGEYAGIDPTIIRLIFALLGIFGGSGIILYLVLWLIVPSQSSLNKTGDPIRENMDEIKGKTQNLVASMKIDDTKNRSWWPILLIALGIIFALNNFGVNLGKLWPVFLVLFGIFLLRKK